MPAEISFRKTQCCYINIRQNMLQGKKTITADKEGLDHERGVTALNWYVPDDTVLKPKIDRTKR